MFYKFAFIVHGFVVSIQAMIVPDTRLNVLFRNQELRLSVKSTEPYNNARLYRIGRTVDGHSIIPIMAVSDNDEESPSKTEAGTYVSPAARGYLIYNLVSVCKFDLILHNFS
jgi:hypothetical protein